MTDKRHSYSLRLDTSAYRAYSRAHEISAQGKTVIAGSSNPVFRGDAARWNPAELLIAALSACHQLWYLHLCADAGIVVVAYSDDASGVEIEQADGTGQFESVTLRPHPSSRPALMKTSRAVCTMPPPANALSRARCRSKWGTNPPSRLCRYKAPASPECPLLAQSGHADHSQQCFAFGGKADTASNLLVPRSPSKASRLSMREAFAFLFLDDMPTRRCPPSVGICTEQTTIDVRSASRA